jgi:hypothetical protein
MVILCFGTVLVMCSIFHNLLLHKYGNIATTVFILWKSILKSKATFSHKVVNYQRYLCRNRQRGGIEAHSGVSEAHNADLHQFKKEVDQDPDSRLSEKQAPPHLPWQH